MHEEIIRNFKEYNLNRKGGINMNKLLAEIAVLNQKTYNHHWNVRGEGFMNVHKMTEALYEGLTGLFDEVAEKIAMSDVLPVSTLSGYIELSEIKEEKERAFKPQEVIKCVVADLEIIKKTILAIETTPENESVVGEVLSFVELQKWLFKSSL